MEDGNNEDWWEEFESRSQLTNEEFGVHGNIHWVVTRTGGNQMPVPEEDRFSRLDCRYF